MGRCVTAILLAVNFTSIHVLNTLNKPCQVEDGDGDAHEDDADMSLTWVWLGCAGVEVSLQLSLSRSPLSR